MKLLHLARSLASCGLMAVSLVVGIHVGARAQPVVDQTSSNVPEVMVIAPPPAGFNPVTATPQTNAQFAIPPAPDARAAPSAYTAWQNAVKTTQKHETLVLTPTNIANAPMPGKR